LIWLFPPEGKNSASPTRVQVPVLPARKPSQAPGPNLLTMRQTIEAKGATTLWPEERRS